MQSKNYGRPVAKHSSVHDATWKPWSQKTQPKPQTNGHNAPWSYVDQSPSKYWHRRPRTINSNLPKIPCSGEGQCQPKQVRQRFVFKNRLYPAQRNHKLGTVESKKSIPDHALMKNLLSGLSIFEEGGRPRLRSAESGVYRHKSMGNIGSFCQRNHGAKPSVRSSVDFTDISRVNRDFNDENFREYCRNYAKESIAKLHHDTVQYIPDRYVPENYFAPKSCTDRLCPFNCERNVTDGCFFKQYPKVLEQDNNMPFCVQRRNIVQERKQFFEKKEKDMKEECIISKCKSPKIFIVPAEKENNGCESVTELYRNAKTIASTTTISRSKHSKPKLGQPKHVELFHPEYNFDDKSSSSDLRQSIIDSIRAKIFQAPSPFPEEDDDFTSDYSRFPRFPRETRKAVSIIMNQKRLCRCRTKQVLNVETQTSPVSSDHSLVALDGLPCTKNLLCRRGLHSGRCEEEISRRLESICREDCLCKRDQYSSEGLRSSLWPTRSRGHSTTQHNLVNEEDEASYADYNYAEYENDDIQKYAERTQYEFGNEVELPFLGSVDQDLATPRSRPEKYRERASYVSPPTSPTMNGMNGHSNGDLNGCGDIITQNQQRGCWTIGLINSKYRYLTAETFGFKINANGTSLKKKQIWTLEPDLSSGGETCIYLKSHLDKYLAVDSFGNVTCESEEKEPGSKFQISVSEDGKGRWAFKNVVRGYFLGSSSDKLTCTAKVPTDAEFWYIHLAARPQVNLRSVGRKRFAHLSENLDEIHVDANIPWGEDTLFTLEFHADEDGKYALHTCNNKYLSNGGKLVDECTEDCLFSAEYHSGQLALRDCSGQYLSPIGSKAVLKTRSNTVTKDELFSLEDSLPQASFVAALNARYVSVKQGVDVTANQDEISDHETFQLEFDWTTKRWYIRTMQDKYWTLETGGGIQASGDKRSSNALFDLVWQNDGSLAFRANNGRYVITKRSGHLYATSDVIEDTCKYFFYLINRPILVLKCEQGFVGYRSSGNPKLECNKATYECIQVERAEKGVIHFKGQNGKYWHVDSESVTADSDAPENFYLELREPTRLCIKTANGNYLTASKNGVFRLGDTSIENATQWEY